MATNQQMREGEAELTRIVRWVDRMAHRGQGEAMDLPHVPSHVMGPLVQTLRFLWVARGPVWQQLVNQAIGLFQQGMTIPDAARIAGQRLNLPPRPPVASGPAGLTPQQVRQQNRQRGRRMEQRGGRPGQDPRTRR